jgi:hypothetical protein
MSQIAISSSATPPTSVAPTNTTPTSNLPAGPPDPRFSYMDINVAGIGSLAAHVTVNGQVSIWCLQFYEFVVCKNKKSLERKSYGERPYLLGR